MKKITVTVIVFINVINLSYSQTYSFIEEVIGYPKSDTVSLMDKFILLEADSFDEFNLRDLWEPLPHPKTPSIETFLNNFSLTHLRADLLSNKNDTLIDFSKLNKNFIKLEEEDISELKKKLHQENNSEDVYKKYLSIGYLRISKPVFNCSKNWAMISIESYIPYASVSSGGIVKIYRKLDSKWILYHKFQTWIP